MRQATQICCSVTPERGGMGGRFKREGPSVYLWMTHVDIWQKPTQYCKAIIFQLKINLEKKKGGRGIA